MNLAKLLIVLYNVVQ